MFCIVGSLFFQLYCRTWIRNRLTMAFPSKGDRTMRKIWRCVSVCGCMCFMMPCGLSIFKLFLHIRIISARIGENQTNIIRHHQTYSDHPEGAECQQFPQHMWPPDPLTPRKKLNARPIVYQTPGSARRRAASLARSTSLMGVVREIVVPQLGASSRWRVDLSHNFHHL